jgi:hypothetical protein
MFLLMPIEAFRSSLGKYLWGNICQISWEKSKSKYLSLGEVTRFPTKSSPFEMSNAAPTVQCSAVQCPSPAYQAFSRDRENIISH